jgi:phosphoenolpyruvate---glycerone phosphotransferase subunit DhaL
MDAHRDRGRVHDGIADGPSRDPPDRCRGPQALPTLAPTPSRCEDAVQAAPAMPSLDPTGAPVVDATVIRAAIGRCAASMQRHAAWLTRLDAVLGDGDHGDNLAIGFRAVTAAVEALPADSSPGAILRAVGHRLVATVGGASGPLYGTAFLEAGHRAGDAEVLDPAMLQAMLAAAADGLARRGRCAPGDKTILDALAPAADAFAATLDHGGSLDSASVAMVRAGLQGMRATRPLVARRGLALRLGARSAGHLDPGAVSCVLLLRALAGP